jgi:MFS family permease
VVSTTVSTFGIGLGPLVAGLLAEYGPWPVRLPFVLYLGLLVPALFLVGWMPKPAARQAVTSGRWHIRTPTVPRALRPAFTVAALAAFASFSILGFFASLTPTFLSDDMGIANLALTGLVIFSVFAASGSVQSALRWLPDRGPSPPAWPSFPLGWC